MEKGIGHPIESPMEKSIEKQAELVQLIKRYAPTEGSHSSAITSLHFTREYARMFGLPPKSDAKHLRDSLNQTIL